MADRDLTVGYVFLTKRPKDHTRWPQCYHDRELAEKAPNRVTAIAAVTFDADGNIVDDELTAAVNEAAEERGAREQCERHIIKLQEQLGAQMGHEQNISQKWQRMIAEVTQELRLRTKGKVSSACSCPIGTCLQYGGTAADGACWLQWAEAYILRRAGEIRIDAIRSLANHPARLAAVARGEGDKPLNPEK